MAVAAVLVRFVAGHVYRFDVKDGKLRVTLFPGIPIVRVRTSSIEAVTVVTWADLLKDPGNYFAFSVGVPFPKKVVVVDRSSGVFRRLLLGAPRADKLADEISTARNRGGVETV